MTNRAGIDATDAPWQELPRAQRRWRVDVPVNLVGPWRADVHLSEETSPIPKSRHRNKEAKNQPQTTFKEKRAAKKAKYNVKAIIPPSPPR